MVLQYHLWCPKLLTTVKMRWEKLKQLQKVLANIIEPRHDKMHLRESLTRPDKNRPAQPQKLARFLKFRLKNLEILHYLSSEQQRRWSDGADAQADLCLCCSHMTWHIFSWPGSTVFIVALSTLLYTCTSSWNCTLCVSASWYSDLILAAVLSAMDIFFSCSWLFSISLSRNCCFSLIDSSLFLTSAFILASCWKQDFCL